MSESERRLRHLPFFEEIASLEEGDAAYRSATAGLVVLRLVDAWLEEGPAAAMDDGWGLLAVHNAIEGVDDGTPIKTLLNRVVESLRTARPDIHAVVTPLMAYARSLEYDAKWLMAADVYQTVLAHLHPVEDADASIAAHLRLGQCFYNLNQLDDAAAAFDTASNVATEVGDIVGVLRARVGEAQLAVRRGNLPRAEQLLDATITEARGPDLDDVRSRALHDRATVAHFRKQYELAIRFAYDALAHAQAPNERDRILSDIAVSFLELGVYSAARDAYLVLSATAQEQYIRWAATLNLLEISTQTHSETLFETYRRQLEQHQLPAYMATAFQLSVGKGYQQFGDSEKAREHLEAALGMAAEHGFNQYLFEAEEALLELVTKKPLRQTPTHLSLDVQEVADAIRYMREAVGVS